MVDDFVVVDRCVGGSSVGSSAFLTVSEMNIRDLFPGVVCISQLPVGREAHTSCEKRFRGPDTALA